MRWQPERYRLTGELAIVAVLLFLPWDIYVFQQWHTLYWLWRDVGYLVLGVIYIAMGSYRIARDRKFRSGDDSQSQSRK